MKNKKIIFLIITIIAILILAITFSKSMSKILKVGNTMTSQEVVDYILNIDSYETKVSVEVKSNKNSNKYILKQQYVSPNTFTQEVEEPSNISGVKIIRNGDNVKLENTTLNLSKLFENYNYIADNCLDLTSFIEDYKNSNESNFEEKNEQIIMKTKSKNDNKYRQYKKLYIDKQTHNPIKMEIEDYNRNALVYISYNEVKLNSISQDEILAFRLYDFDYQV